MPHLNSEEHQGTDNGNHPEELTGVAKDWDNSMTVIVASPVLGQLLRRVG